MVKHAFTSEKSDGADATQVQPSNWNADHLLTPDVIQIKMGDPTVATLVLNSAPTDGHTLVLYTDSTTGQVSAVSSTNTTWSQMTTQTSAASTYHAVWIGKVSGTGGTTITITKPGTYLTAVVLEIADSVGTPSLGAVSKGNLVSGSNNFFRLTGGTSGRLVVYGTGVDNTTILTRSRPNNPASGVFEYFVTLTVAYSTALSQTMFAYSGDAGAYIMCEIY